MKRIHILENALRYLLDEGRNAEKAKQKTIAVMKNYLSQHGVQGEQLESMAEEYEHSLKELLFHANMPDSIIRLEPIMANVAMQIGFTPENRNTRELYRLKDITSYIIANYQKEGFPIALNKLTIENTTFESLNELFGNAIDASKGAWNSSSNDSSNYHYTVKRLDTFEEAHKYHPYTQDICYLGGKGTWNQYTSNEINTVYVLLRDGWQDVPAEHGEDTPYDDYGKSMVFVIIRPDGKVAYTNTRWNHNTNGQGPRDVDQSFRDRMGEISDMLHTDYWNVLKPYHTFENLTAKAEQLLERARQGENIRDLFDYSYDLGEGRFCIMFGRWKNITDESYNILSPQRWYNFLTSYRDGVIIAGFDDKQTLLDRQGKQICGWYDFIDDFAEGFAKVSKNPQEYAFINRQGQRICRWYYFVINFHDGLALVQRDDDNWSMINTEGKHICGWYSAIGTDNDNGFCVKNDDDEYSMLNKQGQQICGWYRELAFVSDDIFTVKDDNSKWTLINMNGKQLCGWYDGITEFYDGVAIIERDDGKWTYIKKNGEQMGNWYKNIKLFADGFGRVQRDDGLWTYVDSNFQYLNGGKEWFSYVGPFYANGLAVVQDVDGLWDIIDAHGNYTYGRGRRLHEEPFINKEGLPKKARKRIRRENKTLINDTLIESTINRIFQYYVQRL